MTEIASGAVLAARLIKRPRLTRLLDETDARVLLLIGPAGYGKTTLAREWLGQGDRRTVWYRGGPAAADVAGLAAGLARVAEPVVPTARRRIEERLRASNEPEAEAELLAELLGEDLSPWPADAWLCFDDYQFAMESEASERFFEVLHAQVRFPLIVTSRERPSWASARRILYGEIFELGRNALAFTIEEASELLADNPRSAVPGLIQLADGWPAVLGLAALSEETRVPDEELPGALYEYFAEELYKRVDGRMLDALFRLALVPSVTRRDAFELLGADGPELLHTLATLGFLSVDQDALWSMHPLLRAFLRSKLKSEKARAVDTLISEIGARLVRKQRWDDAFALVEEFGTTPLIVQLMEASLKSLLAQGRQPTLSRWLEWARARTLDSPMLDLAEAELSLRGGDHDRAESLAAQAAQRLGQPGGATAAAWLVAGRAAHLASRDETALHYLHRAAESAVDDAGLEEAFWLQLQAYKETDPARVIEPLERLRGLRRDQAEHRIRLATAEASLSSQSGRLREAIESLKPEYYVLPRATDPMVRSSFLFRLGYFFMLAGQYTDSVKVLGQALTEAIDYRLAFAVPHILTNLAAAQQGLRNFAQAHALLDRVLSTARRLDDPYLLLNERSVRCRVLLSEGRLDEAATTTAFTPRGSTTASMRAEYLATRALALACRDMSHEVVSPRDHALELRPQDLEVMGLIACADVLLAHTHRPCGFERMLNRLLAFLQASGSVDAFVCSYRARPKILEPVSQSHAYRSFLASVLREAKDFKLAQQIGLEMTDIGAPVSSLTKRESEVHALIAQGLTNKEIAQRLFISEPTAKVHVRHIFEKLGVRTRAEAAARATLDDELVRLLKQRLPDAPNIDPQTPA